MRRGQVDAPPVAPRYQRSGHEGAAHRKRGAGDGRVPGQSCCCLKVDEERRRVRDKRARQSWCGSRAPRQVYGAARCGHVVTRVAAVACVRSVLPVSDAAATLHVWQWMQSSTRGGQGINMQYLDPRIRAIERFLLGSKNTTC